MKAKYEITAIAHKQYPWLHRIRALCDVREDVHTGDLGGFVENEGNLSQTGSCWIYDNAIVCENASVTEQAVVRGHCMACDSAVLSGNAELARTWIMDQAHVSAGMITNLAVIAGDAKVLAHPQSQESPIIKNDAVIYGTVIGNVEVSKFYELLPGETIENHGKERHRVFAEEYCGSLMPVREPKQPVESPSPKKKLHRGDAR